jgi:hypothetical protein
VSNFKYVAAVAQNFLIIVAAYVLCHGVTAFGVKPVQELFIPHVTIFASLIYLPHGVRVLATWMLGWRAIIPLLTGAYLSNLLFTPDEVRAVTDPVILQSNMVGALSAYAAFGLMKIFGRDIAANGGRSMDWKWLLIVGAMASVLNSVGQSIVFSGLIFPDQAFVALAIFAVGDLAGLAVNMLVLLLIFRWIRLFYQSG